MINSKKAAIAVTVIVIIIIAIISSTLVLIIFTKVAQGVGAESTFPDTMCRINTALVEKLPSGSKWILKWFFCSSRTTKLDATDWEKCPETYTDYKTSIEAKETPPEAIKNCASEQLANLAMRCWQMYGREKWDFGSYWDYECFKVKISRHIGDNTVKESDVTEFLDCDFLENNKCRSGDCSYCGDSNFIWWDKYLEGDIWKEAKVDANDGYWKICFHDSGVTDIGPLRHDKLVFVQSRNCGVF